jgi:hypothetical protein
MPTKAERMAARAQKLKDGEKRRHAKREEKAQKKEDEDHKDPYDMSVYKQAQAAMKTLGDEIKTFIKKAMNDLELKVQASSVTGRKYIETVQELKTFTVQDVIESHKPHNNTTPAYFTGHNSSLANESLKKMTKKFLRQKACLEALKRTVLDAVLPHHRALNDVSYYQDILQRLESNNDSEKELFLETFTKEDLLKKLEDAQSHVAQSRAEYEKAKPLYDTMSFYDSTLRIDTGTEKSATSTPLSAYIPL